MPFLPALEIGVWNLWIFMVAWVFFHMVPITWPIFRYDIKVMFKKGAASPAYNKREKIINNLMTAVWIVLFVYSIFLTLPLGTPFLYAGIALFAAGVIIVEIAMIPWVKTAIDEPVTKGLYRYSRHPVYIGVYLQQIGIGIAAASGLFLLLTITQVALSMVLAPAEERFCSEKYGDTYQVYMNSAPRWLGIPKA
jgi:protein-S-isoprenylcysteine O-methyltransferase Ste14